MADLEHGRWSHWMRYMFTKGVDNPDGSWTMPPWAVERWRRQMETLYSELSEKEKESDRAEADKNIALYLKFQNSTDEPPLYI